MGGGDRWTARHWGTEPWRGCGEGAWWEGTLGPAAKGQSLPLSGTQFPHLSPLTDRLDDH